MIYTCAEAAKLLRSLNEELSVLRSREQKSFRFTASIEEDIESARPLYNYQEEQKKQDDLMKKIRIVKHAINRFNLETLVPDFNMTIDEILVYIPQLSEKKKKLMNMAAYLPKERASDSSYGSKIIEYTYTNYEISEAQADLVKVTDELAKAQTSLDLINNQATMEINFDCD